MIDFPICGLPEPLAVVWTGVQHTEYACVFCVLQLRPKQTAHIRSRTHVREQQAT